MKRNFSNNFFRYRDLLILFQILFDDEFKIYANYINNNNTNTTNTSKYNLYVISTVCV